MLSWTIASFKSRAKMELAGFFILAIVAFLVGAHYDAVELFYEASRDHEDWNLDEVVLALCSFGFLGFIYAGRWANELKKEVVRRQTAERSISWSALHDALTKLPNRRFLQSFSSTRDKAGFDKNTKPATVFSIDLNGFKAVNDLHGHHVGDALLVEVAQRLSALMPNDLVIRLGGDEFCVITELDDQDSDHVLAREIIARLSHPILINGIQTTIGASVGVARHPLHATTLAETMMCADIAMYESKKLKGAVPIDFQFHMRDQMTIRVELENLLRLAINKGEIIPYYQPLVDLKTGEVEGFEALARWRQPSGEFIPPLTFIPVAEQSGLIVPLAEILLRHACRDAMTWPSHVRLSFNVSPVQLSDPLLALKIIAVLGETGLSPHRLELEITESVIVNDFDTARRTLQELRRAGVRIAIDDFGMGYSNLAQLSDLSFDKIKIDRSFVAEMISNPKHRNLVRAIVSMGQGLGMMTTAEGIEGAAQFAELKALGCNSGQGYFFGKACPAAEALAAAKGETSEQPRREAV